MSASRPLEDENARRGHSSACKVVDAVGQLDTTVIIGCFLVLNASKKGNDRLFPMLKIEFHGTRFVTWQLRTDKVQR